MIEYVPGNCFITRFKAVVSALVGPCCPALLKLYRRKCAYCCIIGQINDDDDDDDDEIKTFVFSYPRCSRETKA